MPSAHIFCSVIDNFGDLGVCWRLARQLAADYALEVVLLVDDLAAFQQLDATIKPSLAVQTLGDVTLMRWHSTEPLDLLPAEFVIEGFACTLPTNYRARIGAATRWINLEYLSAETWVDGCHGLSSPQPEGSHTLFWFPGFTPRSGGLLRERGLLQRLHDRDRIDACCHRHGLPTPTDNTARILLFCYDTEAVQALLSALKETPSELIICAGYALSAVNASLPQPLAVGESQRHGHSTLYALPMLSHDDFDTLLASADLNIIRGEDSFVRAQWAAKPLLWHIYPQDALAHETKLTAWLARVIAVADASVHADSTLASWQRAQTAWQAAQWAWVRNELTPAHIEALLAERKVLTRLMHHWREHLMTMSDLATQLMRFYANQVESTPEKTHPDKPL